MGDNSGGEPLLECEYGLLRFCGNEESLDMPTVRGIGEQMTTSAEAVK